MKPVPEQKPELRQTLQLSPAFIHALKTLELGGEDMRTMLAQQAQKNPSVHLKETENFPIDTDHMVQEDDAREDLRRQLHESDCDQRIGTYIVDSLDRHGWFTVPIARAAKDLKVSAKAVNAVLHVIQSFEPAGVGGTSLEDCLLLQIQRRHGSKKLCRAVGCLELFARGQFRKAANAIKCTEAESRELFHEIQRLNPYPVHLGTPDAMTLFPDVSVAIVDGELTYSLYAWEETFTVSRGSREQQRAAEELQKLCESRTVLLKKIVDVLMTHQKEYFFGGPLRPLTCSAVAEQLNVSVSTVTRALAHKAFQFEDVLHPLSDLLSSDAGGNVAQKEVMKQIRQLIQNEDPAHPYSDQTLQRMLEDDGIHIAKRTVTKYRLAMHILSYSKRRKY